MNNSMQSNTANSPEDAPSGDGGTPPVLSIRNLSVSFRDEEGQSVEVVHDVSMDVSQGEVLALVGESGSGKSVTAMAALGLLPFNAEARGAVEVLGTNVLAATRQELTKLRVGGLSVIFQDPTNALNPVLTVGFQLRESIRMAQPDLSVAERKARALELLELVEIRDAESKLDSYPSQLSGGQCQRVMIAMALAGNPRVLIADEPTTALDVTVQDGVLKTLRRLCAQLDLAVLLITHDMGVVAEIATRVAVMRGGRIVEEQGVIALFEAPKEVYTKELLDSVLDIREIPAEPPSVPRELTEHPVLELRNVGVNFRNARGRATSVAVNDFSLSLTRGEIVGLVGESGSGKSTVSKCAIGLQRVSRGAVFINGMDLSRVRGRSLRMLRKDIGVVFQNPATSLNPRMSIGDSVGEGLRIHGGMRGSELKARVEQLLDSVSIDPSWRSRLPHELSGGQRQRVAIAKAVSLSPRLLIADEPTSALDVTVQAGVLQLIQDLHAEYGFACLFISHDLAVVNALCHRVAVMRRGEIEELGTRSEVLFNPRSEYTRSLVDASPKADPRLQASRRLTA